MEDFGAESLSLKDVEGLIDTLRKGIFYDLTHIARYCKTLDENVSLLGGNPPCLGEMSVASFVRIAPYSIRFNLPVKVRRHIFFLAHRVLLEKKVVDLFEKFKRGGFEYFHEVVPCKEGSIASLSSFKTYVVNSYGQNPGKNIRILQGKELKRKLLEDNAQDGSVENKVSAHYQNLAIKNFDDSNRSENKEESIGCHFDIDNPIFCRFPFILYSNNPVRRFPAGLSDRNIEVLIHRHTYKKTLEETGHHFQMTRERVRQISFLAEKRIMEGDLKYESIDIFFAELAFYFLDNDWLVLDGQQYSGHAVKPHPRTTLEGVKHIAYANAGWTVDSDDFMASAKLIFGIDYDFMLCASDYMNLGGIPFAGLQDKILHDKNIEIITVETMSQDQRLSGCSKIGYLLSPKAQDARRAIKEELVLKKDSQEYLLAESLLPPTLFDSILKNNFEYKEYFNLFVRSNYSGTGKKRVFLLEFLRLNGGRVAVSEAEKFMEQNRHALLSLINNVPDIGYDRSSQEVGFDLESPKKVTEIALNILEEKKFGISQYDLFIEVSKVRKLSEWSLTGIRYNQNVGVLPNGHIALLKNGGSPVDDEYFGPVPKGCREFDNGDFSILLKVTSDMLRGSGTGITAWALAKCELTRWPSSIEFQNKEFNSIHLRRNATQTSISSLREMLERESLNLGDKFILKFSIKNKIFSMIRD